MLDIEPELDRKLRAFYDHIEAQDPPASLELIATPALPSGRKVLGRLVSVAGIAAIAAGIVLFATELNAHRITTPTTHPASPPSPGWSPNSRREAICQPPAVPGARPLKPTTS